MVKVYPINSDGRQCGPVRSFTDDKWAKMQKTFKKNLAYKIWEGQKEEKPVGTKNTVPVKKNRNEK